MNPAVTAYFKEIGAKGGRSKSVAKLAALRRNAQQPRPGARKGGKVEEAGLRRESTAV